MPFYNFFLNPLKYSLLEFYLRTIMFLLHKWNNANISKNVIIFTNSPFFTTWANIKTFHRLSMFVNFMFSNS